MKHNPEVTIQIHCCDLPGTPSIEKASLRLGIQRGQDIIEDVPADAPDVTFTFPLVVNRNLKSGRPNFAGPFAQGTPGERFIYLCWGERHDGTWDSFRRAKIHLKHLSWRSVEKVLRDGTTIKVAVNMTDDKGGPLCGSVPEDTVEWQL